MAQRRGAVVRIDAQLIEDGLIAEHGLEFGRFPGAGDHRAEDPCDAFGGFFAQDSIEQQALPGPRGGGGRSHDEGVIRAVFGKNRGYGPLGEQYGQHPQGGGFAENAAALGEPVLLHPEFTKRLLHDHALAPRFGEQHGIGDAAAERRHGAVAGEIWRGVLSGEFNQRRRIAGRNTGPAHNAKIEVPMTADLKLVSKLQTLDLKIGGLQREVATLPKHIALIEKTLDGHVRRLEADRAALSANQKERKRLEEDIKVQQQKVSKLRDQMLEAKTNEQYRAFQNEIEFCEKEVRKSEDRTLDLMGESEPLEKNVKTAEAALTEEKRQVDAEKATAREATAKDQEQLDVLKAERQKIVAQLTPELHKDYERIRKKWRGTVIAEILEGRCSACQIVLRPQFFQDLKRGEELMFCESCGRIVFYNPPVRVEPDLATAPR